MGVLDHVETHVDDIDRYCRFLQAVFEGGDFEVISPSGTSMFTGPDGIRIEVKKRKTNAPPIMSGFCNPCLRRENPYQLLAKLGLNATHERDGGGHIVVFFMDHEGVTWHIKDLP